MTQCFIVHSGMYEDESYMRFFTDYQRALKHFDKKFGTWDFAVREVQEKEFDKNGTRIIRTRNKDYGTWAVLIEVKPG